MVGAVGDRADSRGPTRTTLMVARAAFRGSLLALCVWLPWAAGASTGRYMAAANEHVDGFLVASVAVGLVTFAASLAHGLRRPTQAASVKRPLLGSAAAFAYLLVLPHALLFAALLHLGQAIAAVEVAALLAVDAWWFALSIRAEGRRGAAS